MYACLCNPHSQKQLQQLLEVAHQFSPTVESAGEDAVLFSIVPLRTLLGPPHQIAAEICRYGFEREMQANLAVAANPDSAILLARHMPGVTLVTPGEERFKLALLPLRCLALHVPAANAKLFETLHRWGLRTCGDLADLDARGVAERLGPDGVYLRDLACGRVDRPLHVPPAPVIYQREMDLEHPLAILEPLLFLLGSALRGLCGQLRSQSLGARTLKLHLKLEKEPLYRCELEFPLPLQEVRTLLKLLQLHLERHPPDAAVLAFRLHLETAPPKRVQQGIFLPTTPLPDRLELTLARIRGMVGSDNVLTPQLLNTYRPDAVGVSPLDTGTREQAALAETDKGEEGNGILRLAIRLFRPALPAQVKTIPAQTIPAQTMQETPRLVSASRVRGEVVRSAGPWKTSGEWWTETRWSRVEWDVALNDGGLYRIYQECANRQWFVQGVYD